MKKDKLMFLCIGMGIGLMITGGIFVVGGFQSSNQEYFLAKEERGKSEADLKIQQSEDEEIYIENELEDHVEEFSENEIVSDVVPFLGDDSLTEAEPPVIMEEQLPIVIEEPVPIVVEEQPPVPAKQLPTEIVEELPPITVTELYIEYSSSATQVANLLEEAGIVDDAYSFLMYVRGQNKDRQLLEGNFVFQSNYDYEDILNVLLRRK
ncbi:hypothetical protein AN640_08025 [Candidatus Epulonipiscium fishelsonii]|uniref:Uncharacterized protein n=1 Tax=Candidatus Epulonipiscium fishelsonii TaxID=77094 RepID=A0ACC8XEB0_9FIRM|nr:hypothetical protein AN640_08025 [Epulopiscium sp. SCG-D08WGA-EpuloA1]